MSSSRTQLSKRLSSNVDSGLAAIPFVNPQFGAYGTATIAATGFASDDPGSKGLGVNIAVPAGVMNAAYLRGQVSGRVVGLRGRRHNASVQPNMGMVVDGEPRPVRLVNTRLNTVPSSFGGGFDGASFVALFDDLTDDGPHTVTVHIPGDPSVSYTAITLFGWLVERDKVGFAAVPPSLGLVTQTLSTTATAISSSAGPTTKALTFFNGGASSRVVTLSGTATIWQATLAAGAVATYSHPTPFKIGSSLKVAQDAGADVILSYVPEGFTP